MSQYAEKPRPSTVAAAKSPRDLAEYHELCLVRARHQCRPVQYLGAQRFIGTIYLGAGDTEMTIYLTGSADKVRPCDITIPEIPT